MPPDPEILYASGPLGGEIASGLAYTKDPNVDPRVICWMQMGGRARQVQVAEVLQDDAEQYAFRDVQGRVLRFKPLTLDYYNQHIRKPGQPIYRSWAGLVDAYLASLTYT